MIDRDKKSNKVIKNLKNYNNTERINITFGVITLVLIFSQKLHGKIEMLSKTLDGTLLGLYSFIISLLSLYGIYLALIQFAIEISSRDNTYFAVNYVRVTLEESYVFKFIKSTIFYISLFFLVVIPIIYKLNIKVYINFYIISMYFNELILYFWNAIAFLLILVFIISLNFGFTKIWDISYNNEDKKRIKCYEKINFFIVKSFELYIINEEEKYGIDSLDIFFDRVLDFKTRFEENKYEVNYFMNNFLENCEISNIKRKEEFFNRYIDTLVNERVELVYNDKTTTIDYPLFTIIDNLSNSYIDEETTIFQKYFSKVYDFLNNQDTIVSSCFARFILEKSNQCDYKMINKLVNLYINKCKYIESLERVLLNKGLIYKIDTEDEFLKCAKLFYIWIKLFTESENKKIKLVFPVRGYFELDSFRNYELLAMNLYSYAAIYYLINNPTTTIFKEIYYSLRDDDRNLYDNNFKTDYSYTYSVDINIYNKLVNEYEKNFNN